MTVATLCQHGERDGREATKRAPMGRNLLPDGSGSYRLEQDGMIKERVEIGGKVDGDGDEMAIGMTEDDLAKEMQGGFGDGDGDLYADDDDEDGLFSGTGPFTGF